MKKGKNNRGKKQKGLRQNIIRFILPAFIILASMTLFPVAVFAQETDAAQNAYCVNTSSEVNVAEENETISLIKGDWDDRHPIRLKGKGTLEASGNGLARIKGRTDEIDDGMVRLSGNGVLLVSDFEGDIDINITGYGGKVELKKDHWLYYGFKGDAEIKGSGFIISLLGEDLEVFAKGTAAVFLAGEGTYKVERYLKPDENIDI